MVRKRSGLVGMGLGAVFSLLLFAIVLVAGMVYADLSSGLPSLETLPLYFDPQSGAILQPTRLFDRTGKVLIAEIDNPGIPRQYLSIDPTAQFHLSPLLAQTVILLNDPTFWQSSGISTQSLSDPHPQTLAEKLALDILLEGETPGLRRAIRMRLLAAQLTARFGRAQVLEWYLNSAYFGHLAYGAESAAQLYLGKSAQDLTLSEALLLAAVARAAGAVLPQSARTLWAASREGKTEVVKLLLEKGADVNAKDKDGTTALWAASTACPI